MGRVSWRQRALERRMRRSFYYSNGRPFDRLSLPLTEAVVEYFSKNAPFDDLNIDYASDVSYAGAVSPSVLIVAMIYLERMRLNNKHHFESSDPADLFTSALLCATKFLYDEAESEFVYNDEWALSCSRSLDQINQNEVDFLNALNWNTMAKEKDFNQMLRQLEMMIAHRQWRWRGFPSYSDLLVLASSFAETWNEVLLPSFAVLGVATLTYMATVFGLFTCALYGSTLDSSRQVISSPLIEPVSPSPPSAPSMTHLPLKPTVVLNVVSELTAFNNLVELFAEEMEPAVATVEKLSPFVENFSLETSVPLQRVNRSGNISFCALEHEKMMNVKLMELPSSSWASWLFESKTAFEIFGF